MIMMPLRLTRPSLQLTGHADFWHPTGFLRDHGWTYDAENDSFCPLDLERAKYMDCDLCDRLFRPDAAGQYEGITRIWGLLRSRRS